MIRQLSCLVWLLQAAWPARCEPAIYRIDPQNSFVHFEVVHFGTSTIRGRFAVPGGRVELDPELGTGEVSLSVSTATVDTGLNVFDTRLRKSDLLACEEHPQAWFVARRLRYEAGQLAEVRGEFTFRGISRGLSLRTVRFACRHDDKTLAEVCGGDFEATLRRSDFGMDFGLPFVADTVKLVVQVEGERQ